MSLEGGLGNRRTRPKARPSLVLIGANMAEEKKNGVALKNDENEFELMLRFFGNEILAIKLAAYNFNGKLIMWAMVTMFFTFMLMEVFGFSAWLGIEAPEYE